MKYLLLLLGTLLLPPACAQNPLILSQREQANVIDEILDDRLKSTNGKKTSRSNWRKTAFLMVKASSGLSTDVKKN